MLQQRFLPYNGTLFQQKTLPQTDYYLTEQQLTQGLLNKHLSRSKMTQRPETNKAETVYFYLFKSIAPPSKGLRTSD